MELLKVIDACSLFFISTIVCFIVMYSFDMIWDMDMRTTKKETRMLG